MKLYDLERGVKIKAELSDGSSYLIFDHVDGMYSYSTTEKGEIIHLSACTDIVEESDGTYKLFEE